jgi:hypothetical protein
MDKTRFIAHRINTVSGLSQVPPEFGVEIDLRDREHGIVLQHDPYQGGELLDDFLARYRHGTLILNVKSERVEFRAIELLQKFKIEDYFFLDSSFTMINHFTRLQNKRFALRFSEFESIETCLAMKGRLEWIWADSIERLPLDLPVFTLLKNNGFKLCLASPELLGRPDEILQYRDFLAQNGIYPDAICTKLGNIALWQGGSKNLG